MNGERYIVVNAQNGPSQRPHVHVSLIGAQKEAARLAAMNPNVKFYIMQAIGFMTNKTANWTGLTGEKDHTDSANRDCLQETQNMHFGDDNIPF